MKNDIKLKEEIYKHILTYDLNESEIKEIDIYVNEILNRFKPILNSHEKILKSNEELEKFKNLVMETIKPE